MYKSSLNLPSMTSFSRLLLVAATNLISTLISSVLTAFEFSLLNSPQKFYPETEAIRLFHQERRFLRLLFQEDLFCQNWLLCAPLISEEFVFHEIFRNSSAVDYNKGFFLSAAQTTGSTLQSSLPVPLSPVIRTFVLVGAISDYIIKFHQFQQKLPTIDPK